MRFVDVFSLYGRRELTLFILQLEKLLEHHVGRDSGCHGNNGRPDTESCLENDVVQLLLLLGCNKISVIGDVFTALHAAVPWAVQAFVIYPSGKSSRFGNTHCFPIHSDYY